MKAAKIVRILTVAPLMALFFLTIFYFGKPDAININDYLFSLLFLTVLPIAAYPLQPVIPGFRDKGREGQRNLAIVMAVVGYVAGIIYAAASGASIYIWSFYLTYLISGIGIVIFNKILHIRASGHACGVLGPVSMLFYYFTARALPALLVVAAVYWASLKTKRHKPKELIWGSVIPLVSLAIALISVNIVF